MSVTKKFCEVEEGLLIGRVSIDANTGVITTDSQLNINSLNLNDNLVISSQGNAILDGTLLVNSKSTLNSLEVVNNTTLDGAVHALSTVHIENDLTLSGNDLITTNLLFNLLDTNALTVNFARAANYINIGNNSDIAVVTFNNNVKIKNNLEVDNNLNIADGNIVYDSSLGTYGTTTLQGILQVEQESTFNSDVNINASLYVSTNTEITGYLKVFNDFNVNDNFTVASATGNTSIDGTLHVVGDTSIDGNLSAATFIGDINSSSIEATSSLIKLKSTNVEISDTIVYLGTGNTGATKDIGFIGHFNNGTYQHTGLLRDATDNTWKLFSNATAEITDTVDVAGVIYDPLKAGNITSTDTITATNNVVTPKVQLPNAQLTGKALTLGAWVIQEDPNNDGSILFSYNGTTVMSLGPTGMLTTANDITSWGTPV